MWVTVRTAVGVGVFAGAGAVGGAVRLASDGARSVVVGSCSSVAPERTPTVAGTATAASAVTPMNTVLMAFRRTGRITVVAMSASDTMTIGRTPFAILTRGRSLAGVLREHPESQRLELTGQFRPKLRRWCRFALDVLKHDRRSTLGDERRTTGEELVQHTPEGIDIRRQLRGLPNTRSGERKWRVPTISRGPKRQSQTHRN